MRTKKRLGQHLLRYYEDARAIALLVGENPAKILEIGPGEGALTEALLAEYPEVDLIAVEFDRDMVKRLKARFKDNQRFKLIQQDILSFDPSEVGQGLSVIGNLPYNISAPALDWTVRCRGSISSAVYMLQREVARRLVSVPRTKDWSPLAIFTQLYFDVTEEISLPPERFIPPPKVHSAVVRLTTRAEPAEELPKLFARTVASAFARRRKTLFNNLVAGFSLTRESVERLLANQELSPTVRAEEMPTEAFRSLALELEKLL